VTRHAWRSEALRLEAKHDHTSKAVATNNLVAARGPTELFDAMKRFDRLMAAPGAACGTLQEELEYRLEEKQKMTLLFTRLLILMHSSKLPACRELAALLQASVPAKSPAHFMIPTAFFASIWKCAGEMAYRVPHTHPCVRAEALPSLPALLSA
jgi:hypothetical protein